MTWQLKFIGSLAEVGAEDWETLERHDDPFTSHAFLLASERHHAAAPKLGWYPRHVIMLDEGGKLLGALPLYLRTMSFGDFSGDWHWAEAFAPAGLRYYPKLVSGIPFTPATGPRFLVRRGVERRPVVERLIAAALEGVRQFACSSWQCLFIDESDSELLAESGFLLRRGTQFHWHNRDYRDFDDFLGGFSAEKRKKVRRERRRVAESGLTLEIRHGHEINAELWESIYPHYLSTFARYGNHAAFSLPFFVEVSAGLGQGLVVFLARNGSRVVAAAICYRSGSTLYGRHWGAEADYHSLHFELCFYQGIDYCIRYGLRRFEPGAQGEHKLSRGFLPESTWSAYWIADGRMRRIIGEYLEREQQAMAVYQDEMSEHSPYKDPLGGESEATDATLP